MQLDSILDAFRGMNLPDELLVLSGQALYKMVGAVLTIVKHSLWLRSLSQVLTAGAFH